MSKKPQLLANHYYHFYNRGVNRSPIFFNRDNWRFFILKMREYFTADLIHILAYCLMPNHYHLLVHLKTDDISKSIMQPFGTSYVKSVNKDQNRVGPLFQGPYKARHIDTEGYLATITRYIHLNPVRAGLVELPEEWPWSSYRDYIGRRQGTLPQCHHILALFPSRAAYRTFVEEELQMTPEFQKKLATYLDV